MPKTPREHDLIKIDFTEHDTIALLELLISMCKENRVSGMVYAVSLKHGRTRDAICGTTGRLADNVIEAAGLAAMLSHKINQESVEKFQGG